MTNQELSQYIELEAAQKRLRDEFERQQAILNSLRRRAKEFLRNHAHADEAILEIQDTYYRLYLDSDELIQINAISKIA
ncbi:MAG: hypothetical protein ACKPCM_15330 [Pseudanabaena sp.]